MPTVIRSGRSTSQVCPIPPAPSRCAVTVSPTDRRRPPRLSAPGLGGASRIECAFRDSSVRAGRDLGDFLALYAHAMRRGQKRALDNVPWRQHSQLGTPKTLMVRNVEIRVPRPKVLLYTPLAAQISRVGGGRIISQVTVWARYDYGAARVVSRLCNGFGCSSRKAFGQRYSSDEPFGCGIPPLKPKFRRVCEDF